MKTNTGRGVVPIRTVGLRLVAALTLLAGLFAFGAGTAGAAEACTLEGYAGTPVLTATPDPAKPGTEVVITGTGFGPPGCETTLKAGDTEIGTVVVGEDGSFTFTWHVPADWPLGEVEISASGAEGVVLASTTVQIVADDAAPTTVPAPAPTDAAPPAASGSPTESGMLPKTGSSILPVLLGGAVLLVVGAGLVVLATRRRSSSEL